MRPRKREVARELMPRVLVGVGALFAWRRGHPGVDTATGTRVVAVLPFENLGDSYNELKRYADAANAYRDAARLKNGDAEVLKKYGYALMRNKQWPEAADALKKVLALKPDDAESVVNLTYVYNSTGQYALAIDMLKPVVAAHPDMSAAFFLKDALEGDPLGISSRHRINELPKVAVLDALKHWNNRP